jgi:Cof subfamily protein (haloacid dehalogenase superfamily)
MAHPGLPKLVATDLDGTLVRSDDTVSAYTHEVLDRVRAAGIRIVGATGRGPRLTELTRNDIRDADFLVLAQGGWVLDQGESQLLRSARLPGADLARALADLEADVGPLSVMVEALAHDDAPLWGDFDPTWRYPVVVERRPRAECLTGDVIKAFARSFEHDVDDLLAAARRIVPAHVASVTQAGLDYVEICPPNVDKGTGLAVVAQAVGVDPADVLVFGDMPNDLPMFAWAGWSRVAVSNAHPEVLAAADEVTLANDEDGVAVYLDRLLSR